MPREYFLKKLLLRYLIELTVRLFILSFLFFLLFPSVVFTAYLAISGIVLNYIESFLGGAIVYIFLYYFLRDKNKRKMGKDLITLYCRNHLEPLLIKFFK